MRPASGATNAKAGPIRNRHGMAVCASGTARPGPTPSVSTRSTAAATKNDARPYTRISYSPRVPQDTDRRGLPHLQQVGRFGTHAFKSCPPMGDSRLRDHHHTATAQADAPAQVRGFGERAEPWIGTLQVRKVANGTSAPESDTANTSCRPSYCS